MHKFRAALSLTFVVFVVSAIVVDETAAIPSRSPGTVSAAGNMSAPRASHTATLLPDGKILIAGGFPGSGRERFQYSSVELYDPSSGKFSLAGEMTVKRSGQTATLLKNGKVLIAGGWSGSEVLNTAELYDPTSKTFTATGNMTVERAGQTATLLPDGRVVLAGGTGPGEEALSSAETYDPSTGAFAGTGSMSSPRQAHTATLLANGKVLIVGGGTGHYPNKTIFKSSELYDPSTGKFSPAGEMVTARHKHAAVLLADGKVLIVGGSDRRDWRGEYSSAELYDPRTGRFAATGSMSLTRFKLPDAVALLKNGMVLVAGGGERAEVYDPARGGFSTASGSFGAAHFFASVTLLPNGQALIAGGYYDDSRSLPSTSNAWVYQP